LLSFLCSLWLTSEVKFQRELNVPRTLRAGNAPEVRSQAGTRRIEYRGVGKVDEFTSELNGLRLGNRETFLEAQVGSRESRSANRGHAAGSECRRSRRPVSRRIEPLVSDHARHRLVTKYVRRSDAICSRAT